LDRAIVLTVKRSQVIPKFGSRTVALLTFATLLPVASRASDPGDEAQLWNELKVTARVTNNIDIVAAGALRLEENYSDLHRASFQLGLNVRPQPWLTLFPNYQYIVNDPADDARKKEHRIGIVAAARIPIKLAEVTLSLGTEYRLREDKKDSWRLRPKLKLKYPLGPERWTASGYLAEEPFYDSSANEFVRNRFFVGIEKQLATNWSVDLYYCRQHDLHGREPDLDIVGVSIGVRFDLARAESRSQPAEK
jgi:uncharacterized protein DUF2490